MNVSMINITTSNDYGNVGLDVNAYHNVDHSTKRKYDKDNINKTFWTYIDKELRGCRTRHTLFIGPPGALPYTNL